MLTCSLNVLSQSYKIEGNELKLEQKIAFKKGTSILTEESKKLLIVVKEFLTEKNYISLLRVEGNVSENDNTDQLLSEKRAMAVSNWLVANGIDCKRLIAVGFGNTKPISSTEDLNHNAINTRITFVMAALRGKLIGAMPENGGGNIAGDVCNTNK